MHLPMWIWGWGLSIGGILAGWYMRGEMDRVEREENMLQLTRIARELRADLAAEWIKEHYGEDQSTEMTT